MAEASGAFIFRTNIDDVASEIRRGVTSISQAADIPQTKAGKNFLAGISEDVQRETLQLAKDVRAYKAQLEALQAAGTPLGNRQTLTQYSNQRLQQSVDAFRGSALSQARGAGLRPSDISKVYVEMERALLKRAADEVRALARTSAGTATGNYVGTGSDLRRKSVNDFDRLTAALMDQERAARDAATAARDSAKAARRTAEATTAGAESAERNARALNENAKVSEQLTEANKKALRNAQQAAATTPAATAAQPAAPRATQQSTQPATPPRRPTDDVDSRTGLVRPPTGPYAGPWTARSYQTGKVGQSETHHILEMAQSEGVDPGFTLTKNGIRVHDPNRARHELDGAYQAAFDNVSDATSAEDKRLYTQRRDSLRKLMDAIASHRDALYEAVQEPSEAALADPGATRRREAHQASAGGAGGGGEPPKPPTPPTPEPPEEPKPPKPPKPPIVHGDTDDEAKAERERLENALAARVADPNDTLRAINKRTAYDPTTETFFRRKLTASNPEPELTRPVDIQHAREDLTARYESDHDKALRAEQRRADQETIRQQRALAQDITQARRAEPEKIVRITGTGGVRTGVEADLRDEDNPRYFERINSKRLRELDPQNPDDVLKLDESTRNLAQMRNQATKAQRDEIARAEQAAHAEDAARTERRTALNLQTARQATPEQFVDVKGGRGVVADLRNDPNNPDYYAPSGKSGGMRRLDPTNDADQIRIADVQGKLAKQQTAELKGVLRDMDAASKSATKELDAVEERRSKKRQKDINDQIKADDKAAKARADLIARDHDAAIKEDKARTQRAERDFGKDYDAAHRENTARDQRELYRDLIATRNAAPEQFQDLPNRVIASVADPNDPQFFQRTGRGRIRQLDPNDQADQSTIDEARRNLALAEQAELDRKRTSDQRVAAKQEAAADRQDQRQQTDYRRQQAREAREEQRQQARDTLDTQRAQRAGLETRLLQGDPTVSDVPRRGMYGGGYIDRSDPANPVYTERQRNGGLGALDASNPVNQTKIEQALASEAEAIERANTATLRRARAEERSQAALESKIETANSQGPAASFGRGFFSGGFGGGGEANSLDSLARSAGTAAKYLIIAKAFGVVQQAAGNVVKQLLDANDSITQLQVAMGTTDEPARSFQNDLQDIAAIGGFNVGEAMDVASKGVRAFGDTLKDANITSDQLGTGFARQAARIATLSNTDLTDAAGNLSAAASGFGVNANEAGFRRITDAIAGGKLAGGGQEKDLSQFLASSAETFNQAGFNPEEASSVGSKVISSLDESGTLAATRLSRLFSILQGGSGKSYLRELNAQIASANQARPADQQVAEVDTNGTAKEQVLQLAKAYKTLNESQKQVLLNRIGGTGQSRELKVLLETVQDQVKKAEGGFDNKGAEQFQQLLDNIRARLNIIKGDIVAITTNLAESGLVEPFLAALAVVQPLVAGLKEVTQALHFLEGIEPFKWAEEIGITVVALRGALYLMRQVQQVGVRGFMGIAEQRIAPGRALNRQRIQEVQDAVEAGGFLAARRTAGGGRYDLGVHGATSDLIRIGRVTGQAQDNLLEARDRRAGLIEKQSRIPKTDAAYDAMQRQIDALDATIARRTERLHRLTDALGQERNDLDDAIRRQDLAKGINERYDRAQEGLAGGRDQALRDVDRREARDQRRIGRVGGNPGADFEAEREAIRQQYREQLRRMTESRTRDLEGVANRDLNAPTGFMAGRQRIREGIRNFGENIADRGLRGAMQQGPTVGDVWKRSLDGLRSGTDALKNDFQELRRQGVNPLMAALRGGTGYERANNAFQAGLGRLNGRDADGNAPLGGTRTQRLRGGVGNVLSNELGWIGGGLLALGAAMQVADAYSGIQAAQGAGRDVLNQNSEVTGSADALQNSAKALNAAASNIDEATSGFSGWIADNLLNGGQGGQQAKDLRDVADFRDAAGSRIAGLEKSAAQSGDKNRYVDAIDLSSPDELTASVKQLTDAGVPAAQVMKALTGSIEQLNAAAEGTPGSALSAVQREKIYDRAGEAAGAGLEALKGANPVSGLNAFQNWGNQHGGNWIADHLPGFLKAGSDPNFSKDLEKKVDLQGVNTRSVEDSARLTAAQLTKQGTDFSTDAGLKTYQDALAKAIGKDVKDPKQAQAIAEAAAKSLGAQSGNAKSLDDPFAMAISIAQNSVTTAQGARQDTQLDDQLKALSSGQDFDQGVHATEVYRDWLKTARNDTEKMLRNAGYSDDIIQQILNFFDNADKQAQVDELQQKRQKAEQSIQRRLQRQGHDLGTITDPTAIEGRRNADSTANLNEAIGATDPDAAAQIMSGMTDAAIEAERKRRQKAAEDAQAKLKRDRDLYKHLGPEDRASMDPALAADEKRAIGAGSAYDTFTQAYGESAPQYTAGDTAAARQAADAQKSGSQAAGDAANVATAEQGVLDAQRAYGYGSKQYWDAVGQVEAAKRTQANDELERAIANRDILTDSSSALDQANAAIRDANDRRNAALARGDKDEAERQRLLGERAKRDRRNAQQELDFLNQRKNIDITNPALLAKQEADEAQARAEAARKDPNTGKDHQAQFDQTAREARNNAEKVAHDQWLSDLQQKDRLGEISHRKFIESIQADIARLKTKKKLTYQEQKQLDDDKEALKAAQDQLTGQFNLGTIKLPSVYEVRRSLLAQAQPGTAGAPGTSTAPVVSAGSTKTTTAADTTKTAAVSAVNTTNNVTINGADFARVVDYLNKVFGKTHRIATTSRKA